jgi:predicted aconitase with swiveling domain
MSRKIFKARALVSGRGRGRALVLEEPLSLWGELDPQTGRITGRSARSGMRVTDRVLVFPCGRGSSSASSILLESVRARTAPAAIITREADAILALGAAVAREMYHSSLPVVVLEADDYFQIRDGQMIEVREDGEVCILPEDQV